MQNNIVTFSEQILHAQNLAMEDDEKLICMGLGIDDPKSIFGTTSGLAERFGKDRVLDMPTSENAMTGIGIGAAISGHRVLMTHQRVDFFLLAMDQLVNNAAKWHYMFNGKMKVPITFRLIIGRGWGQGPTHQQSLQSWFSHIPGLEVITPGLTDNVGSLLYKSIMSNNPTVFLEHRWLHNQRLASDLCTPIISRTNTTRRISVGESITIISNSYMLVECLRAKDCLFEMGISLDIIEVSEPRNIDWDLIGESLIKTKKCIVTDIGHRSFSFSSEIVASICERFFQILDRAPIRLALPEYPEPTSYGLTRNYYNNHIDIANSALGLLNIERKIDINIFDDHDVPDEFFKGPF